MEVESSRVVWEGDVAQCELLLAAKPDEDCGAMMNMRFIYIHLLQSIEEDNVGGRAVVNEYSLDPAVGYEQRDDYNVMLRVDQCGVFIVDEDEH